MTRDDIIDVLTAVAAADRRTVGQADVAVWQGVIGDLDRQDALDAVVDHLRERPGIWLEPGHIRARVRAKHRDTLEREPDTAREARQAALDARLADAVDAIGTMPTTTPPRFVRASQRPDGHRNPLAVRCPWCRAGEFKPCQIPGTEITMRELHPSRIELADAA